MAEFIIGCSQITWRREASPEQILKEISATGYVGAPAGYREGQTPAEVKASYDSVGLRPAPGYLSGRFYDPTKTRELLEAARRNAAFEAALGCRQLFVAGDCFAERFAVAGHQTANRSDQLSPDGYRVMADTLNEVGRICLEHGVQACFHNHAGSYIETRDEFDRLLALTDPSLVFIGLDTGHLCYGGGDVADFARTYAPRIKTLHLKDVNPRVLEEGRRQKHDYHRMGENGIWAELGEGCVDFPSLFASLRAVDYVGWAIVEIDRTMKPSPLESIQISYRYLRELVFGQAGKEG